jgi:DoxX-like protein
MTMRLNVLLWIVQGLLAALFLFAGGFKLIMPIGAFPATLPVSGQFLRFIGVCEILGAIGLILPSLLRIRPGLTPIAASGLLIIMIGATTLMLRSQGVSSAVVPCIAGLLAAGVAYGRWRLAPITPASIRRQNGYSHA